MGKDKRNKKYGGPKYVARNPMLTFFGGMSGQHAEHLQRTKLINHAALANLARGAGDKEDWERLVGAVNHAIIMCEQGIGLEFRDHMIAARVALTECGKRAYRNELRFVFTGDELKALNEAMDCHDAQLENVRAIDVDRAANEVQRRLRHGINSTSVRAEVEKEEQQNAAA